MYSTCSPVFSNSPLFLRLGRYLFFAVRPVQSLFPICTKKENFFSSADRSRALPIHLPTTSWTIGSHICSFLPLRTPNTVPTPLFLFLFLFALLSGPTFPSLFFGRSSCCSRNTSYIRYISCIHHHLSSLIHRLFVPGHHRRISLPYHHTRRPTTFYLPLPCLPVTNAPIIGRYLSVKTRFVVQSINDSMNDATNDTIHPSNNRVVRSRRQLRQQRRRRRWLSSRGRLGHVRLIPTMSILPCRPAFPVPVPLYMTTPAPL